MARPHRCDVPGCTRTRRRWQRVCEHCWSHLPGDIRTEIVDAHHQGRRTDWRRACKRAAAHFAVDAASPPPPRISAQEAFDRTQRLLGER